MKLVGRIPIVPVEPLDDERMTNIERRIVAGAADAAAAPRAARSSPGVALAAVAVVVVIAGIVGWKLRGEPAREEVAETSTIIRTDRERSTLDIGDARIASDPGTVFAVTRPDGGVLVAMVRGRVELEVGARGSRAPLVVRAGDTDVVVVGTRFSVEFDDATGAVDVRVAEGVVKVFRRGAGATETRVASGETWNRGAGLLAIAGQGIASTNAGRGSSVEPEPEPPAVRVGGLRPATIPHDAALAPRPRSLDDPRDPEFELKTAIRRQPVLPAQDVAMPDATAAIARYRGIVTDKTKMGDQASFALYSIAVVQHLKLARHDDALATLDTYIRRFKTGPEYRAALWLRVRIACLTAIDSACRQAAYTYAHEAGNSPAGRIAERITMSR